MNHPTVLVTEPTLSNLLADGADLIDRQALRIVLLEAENAALRDLLPFPPERS